MKKIIYIILISAFITSCSKKEQQPEDSHSDQHALELTPEQIKVNNIKFGTVQPRFLDSRKTVSGIIHAIPQNTSSIHSPIDGFIDKVNFITGEYVKKGQVLATIKNPSFISIQKQFLESYFNMNLNLKDYQRKKSLLEEDAISRKSYEQAQAVYQVSASEYESLKSELQLLGFNPNSIQSTKKINPVLPVISPRNGFIQAQEIAPGKQVTSADELFMVIDQSDLHVELNVPSKYAVNLFIGQNIEFTLPEIQDTLKGHIHIIGKVTNTENNTVQVHADIDSKLPSTNFYEGRYVNAVIINKTQAVSTLPKEAVFEEEGKKYIFIKEGKLVEKKEIQTGAENKEFVEVHGLDPKQKVVVSGIYYLKAGEVESGHSH